VFLLHLPSPDLIVLVIPLFQSPNLFGTKIYPSHRHLSQMLNLHVLLQGHQPLLELLPTALY